MVDHRIIPALWEHAEAMAPHMRAEDAAEVRASGNYSPLAALLVSLEASSEAHTVLFNGEIVAIFGVCPVPGGSILGGPEVVAVWALTSTVADRYPIAFAKLSKRILAALLKSHPSMVNAIDARYAAALRWAKWLGFEVREAIPFGHFEMPFHPIIIKRGSHV